MGAIVGYLRVHRWQRRLLTLLVAVAAGAVAAILVYPRIQEHLLIRRLGSEDRGVRDKAIRQAAAEAGKSARFLLRLEDALRTDDDRQFAAAALALRRLGKFDTPARDPIQVDRMRAIDIGRTRSEMDPQAAADTRRTMLSRAVLSGRDNPHVRRALRLAASDEAAAVRELAPLLAARLGDDEALRAMLADPDPAVASAAALGAALAGRAGLAGAIAELAQTATRVEVVSSAAYALAMLDGGKYSGRLCAMLESSQDAVLRDRLLHVMTVLDDSGARRVVLDMLGGRRQADTPPPAMAILAAGKLKIHAAATDIKDALAALVAGGRGFSEGHVLSLLAAAEMLHAPVRAEAYALCEKLWNPREYQLILVRAARLLGDRAAEAQPPGAPSTEQCIQLLRRCARYAAPATGPAESRTAFLTAPVPSAAAAVALWMLQPAGSMYTAIEPAPAGPGGTWMWETDSGSSAYYVCSAAAAETTLPGEYVAWHLARSGRPEAFELGLEMLPPPPRPDVPLPLQPPRAYNNNLRFAGAMLLALAAATDGQRHTAIERIDSRLTGGPFGPEDDFFVIGAYRCALLVLGRADQLPAVRALLGTADFPQRAALTALCAAAGREAMDWLLWSPDASPEDIGVLLINKGIGEVLSAAAPGLPPVDAAAGSDLRLWQIRILRFDYAIRRGRIRIELPPRQAPAGRRHSTSDTRGS